MTSQLTVSGHCKELLFACMCGRISFLTYARIAKTMARIFLGSGYILTKAWARMFFGFHKYQMRKYLGTPWLLSGTNTIVLKRRLMCWSIFILSEEKPTIAEKHWTGFSWDDDISLLNVSDSSIQRFLTLLKWYTIPSQLHTQSYLCLFWPYNL